VILSAVVTNGKACFDPRDEDNLKAFIRSHEGKRLWFVIQKERPPRTLTQNAYYHAAVIQTISDYTGDDAKSTHENLKQMFLPQFFDDKGQPIEKSTTRLTTKEFAQYIDRIIAWAGTEHGLAIPSPNEA
jgi:hypothetical protein